MSHYFQLQTKLLHRQFKDFGLLPVWGWLIGLVIFTGASWVLFSKTQYAPYCYVFFALTCLLKSGEQKRTSFLKIVFPLNQYRKIRLTENAIIALPFIVFLLIKQNALIAGILLLLAFFTSFFDRSINFYKTIPTPFGKKPFEFLVGFRRSVLLILGLYLLIGISIVVHNFNLGLVSMAGLFFLLISFCSWQEPLYYLWNNNRLPKALLAEKIKTGTWHSLYLSTLPLIALLIAHPEKWWWLLVLQLLACCYLALMVLIKYTSYPEEIGLAQWLSFGACAGFPPLLLGAIPFYYSRSVNKLSQYLS